MQTAFLMIRCRHGKTGLVSSRLRKLQEITDLHEVMGRFDIIAKVETDDEDKLKSFLRNRIRVIEDIKSAETLPSTYDLLEEEYVYEE